METWLPISQLFPGESPSPALAPPVPVAAVVDTSTAWSEGNKVVTRNQNTLPTRCYKCNQPAAEPPLKRQLSWHTPWLYILVFFGLIIYVIIAIFVRDRATVSIHLCPAHLKRRKYFILAGSLGFCLSWVVMIAGGAMNQTWMIALGVVLLIVAPIAGIVGSKISQTLRIKNGVVWLGGAGKEFLASLPPWPSAKV